MTSLHEPLALRRGPALRNRLALAPLTNTQSHADGTLSDDEIGWLTARARGGFGLVVTAAAYVQRSGLAWAGQLGVASDDHLPGLTRLADGLRAAGAVSAVQLHHGGIRADAAASGEPAVAPFDDARSGARALTTGEVEQLVADFAAWRRGASGRVSTASRCTGRTGTSWGSSSTWCATTAPTATAGTPPAAPACCTRWSRPSAR